MCGISNLWRKHSQIGQKLMLFLRVQTIFFVMCEKHGPQILNETIWQNKLSSTSMMKYNINQGHSCIDLFYWNWINSSLLCRSSRLFKRHKKTSLLCSPISEEEWQLPSYLEKWLTELRLHPNLAKAELKAKKNAGTVKPKFSKTPNIKNLKCLGRKWAPSDSIQKWTSEVLLTFSKKIPAI